MAVEGVRLAPYNPTSTAAISIIVQKVVDIASIHSAATRKCSFLDIGCGDGRVVLAVAQALPECTCVGIEMDDKHCTKWPADVPTNVELIRGDATKIKLEQDPHIIFAYLVPDGLACIGDMLERTIASGGVVITNIFSAGLLNDRADILHEKIASSHGLSVHVYSKALAS